MVRQLKVQPEHTQIVLNDVCETHRPRCIDLRHRL